jgi:hypothetical protein
MNTNLIRAAHHAPPLVWNSELAALAKKRTDAQAKRATFHQNHDDLYLPDGRRVGQVCAWVCVHLST